MSYVVLFTKFEFKFYFVSQPLTFTSEWSSDWRSCDECSTKYSHVRRSKPYLPG